MRQRAILIAASVILGMGLVVVLPHSTINRLSALFGEEHKEADESAASRMYLFKQSVLYTIQHPIFGVGPDQFSNFEGKTSLSQGQHGNWHVSHCGFTQVSSECGIPALFFFVASLGTAMIVVNRSYRKARAQGNAEVANACLCYLLAMVGFLTAITFLANAYGFYLPAMVGLSGVLASAANAKLAAEEDTRLSRAPLPGGMLRPNTPVPAI